MSIMASATDAIRICARQRPRQANPGVLAPPERSRQKAVEVESEFYDRNISIPVIRYAFRLLHWTLDDPTGLRIHTLMRS